MLRLGFSRLVIRIFLWRNELGLLNTDTNEEGRFLPTKRIFEDRTLANLSAKDSLSTSALHIYALSLYLRCFLLKIFPCLGKELQA